MQRKFKSIKFTDKIFYNFKDYQKIIIIIFLLGYLPFCMYSIYIYNKSVKILENEKLSALDVFIDKNMEQIDFYLYSIEEDAKGFCNKKAVKKTTEVFYTLNLAMQKNVRISFRNWLEKVKIDNYLIDEFIYIINERNEIMNYFGETNMDLDYLYMSDEYKNTAKQNGVWIKQDDSMFVEKKDGLVFLKTVTTNEGEQVGLLMTFLDEIPFLYDKINTSKDEMTLFIYDNKEGRLIKEQEFYKDLDIDYTKVSDEYNFIKINGKEYAYKIKKLDRLDWNLGSLISMDEINDSIKKKFSALLWSFIFIGMFLYLLFFIGINYISRLVTEKEISSYKLKAVEENNEKLRIYRHDFLNHLQIVRGLIEMNHESKALNYLEKIGAEGKGIRASFEINIPELESTILNFTSKASKIGIKTELNLVKLNKENLDCDIYDLSKVLNNLLKNAYEALESEVGERILKMNVFNSREYYVFEIVNNKPLIDGELRENIFKKNYTTKQRGSGLGLHIIKTLCDKNNMDLNLDTDFEGNHFYIRVKKH
ncbi:Spo0B domain-containing protein [Peptostreptococcaceae bacterium AGR-M142]